MNNKFQQQPPTPDLSGLYERVKPKSIDEVMQLPDPKQIIKGWLIENGLSVWFGEPKCTKSFLMTATALSVARGTDWFGRKVSRGLVIYVVAEGQSGMKNRIKAFLQRHQIEDEDIPFHMVMASVDLLQPDADTAGIIYWVKQIEIETELKCKMVVIDTLSRTMAGGNENSPEDMTQFIQNCDRIRERAEAHVAVVHHTPKNGSSPRGHSSLIGAADAVIRVEKHKDGNTATLEACKDFQDGVQVGYKLLVEELGEDEDGDQITSCIVEPADVEIETKAKKLSGIEQLGMQALCNTIDKVGKKVTNNNIPAGAICVQMEHWRIEFYAMKHGEQESKKKAFQRLTSKLQNIGRIGIYQDDVWLVNKSVGT